jgi:hypothetical protein
LGLTKKYPDVIKSVAVCLLCKNLYGSQNSQAPHAGHTLHVAEWHERPDFRTINNFRSSKAKEVIEILFKEMLEFLLEQGYIKMENYFSDGSTFTSDVNKHKMVWKKNAQRYKAATEERCQSLFKEIDELNATEDKQYGKRDLEENGKSSVITTEAINKQATKLNEKLKTVKSR